MAVMIGLIGCCGDMTLAETSDCEERLPTVTLLGSAPSEIVTMNNDNNTSS